MNHIYDEKLYNSKSYGFIIRELANHGALYSVLQQHDDIEEEQTSYQVSLKPAPKNCNTPELLLMTNSLHLLVQMLFDNYEKMFEQDFKFLKNILFHPKFSKQHEEMVQKKVAKLVKQLCHELKFSRTLQPEKIIKAMSLLNKLKAFPGMKPELKDDLQKTIQRLKTLQFKLQHQAKMAPKPTTQADGIRPKPEPELRKKIEDDLPPSLKRLLDPRLIMRP